LYAIIICLVYYYAVAESFQDWSLYEFGTTVYTGLLLSLQLKVGFLHHQWNWVHTLSMAVSIGGMFIMYPVCSDIFSDYIYISSYVYDQSVYWLFGVFTIPVFTILIDMIGHYGRLLVWPTQEMLYREIEHKSLFQADAALSQCKSPPSDPNPSRVSDARVNVEAANRGRANSKGAEKSGSNPDLVKSASAEFGPHRAKL